MQKQLQLKERQLTYTLRTSRRGRQIRLAVHGDGRVIITAPRRIPHTLIENCIRQKADWLLQKIADLESSPKKYIPGGFAEEYKRYKEQARALVYQRLEHFNQPYQFSYEKISIRNQQTRWGSCSRKGNLSFNYKIALLPPHLADYIIVHELCHVGVFNHSRQFWQLVAKTLPDYAQLRRELKA